LLLAVGRCSLLSLQQVLKYAVIMAVGDNLCRVKNVTGALPEDTPTGNCQDPERFL
jgi:hypothetical protein